MGACVGTADAVAVAGVRVELTDAPATKTVGRDEPVCDGVAVGVGDDDGDRSFVYAPGASDGETGPP
jgi:hypothetical protein